MSESRSKGVYLQPLSKEDLKALAKKQQKAKRDEEAKTAKTRPSSYNAPMGSSVSFDAPVKVSNREVDSDNRKLMDILGPYDRMSHVIMSGKTRDLMGVEQQPATPLPSKNAGTAFFDQKKNQGKNSVKELPFSNRNSNSSNRQKDRTNVTARPDVSNKQRTSASDMKPPGTKEHPSKHKEPVNVDSKGRPLPTSQSASKASSVSSSLTEKPNRSDQRDSVNFTNSSSSSSQKQVSNSQKGSKLVESSNQNSRKDITGSSGKPTNEVRVPVLDSLNQEFIGQAKRENNQSVSSALKSSSNQQYSVKSAERTSKKPPAEPSTVLQESKEENKNAPNGKFRDKPRLQIPEKNVEDMLKELTHMPQPLTGIQTPSIIDSKFAFQEKLVEPFTARDETVRSRSTFTAPVKVESKKNMVVEEIQDKSESESSDSGDDDGGNDDDADDDEDDGSSGSGSASEAEEEEEEGEVKSDKEEDIPVPEVKVTEVKIQPPVEKIPVPTTTNPTIAAATKGPPVKQQGPMSSSDSSSSGSESSDSGSDSESGSDVSDNEKPDSPPDKGNVTPSKMKTTSEYIDTTPSPSRQSWNLGAFLPCRTEASGPLSSNTKPISMEAPASDKSDPDHFDDGVIEKRLADHISDENPQSVDQESVAKPMSADEFSPPASSLIDKQMLSPIKSPQSVKSPTKRTSSSVTDKAQSDNASAKTKTEASVTYIDRFSSIKQRERKKSTSISSPDPVKEPVKQKQSQGRKSKQKKKVTPSLVLDDTSSSDSEIEVNNSSPLKTLPKSPRKTVNAVSNDIYKPSVMPSLSSSSSSKKKESKREKLIKEKSSVKLKKSDVLHSKQSNCDISEKAMLNMPSYSEDIEADSMKNIFQYFKGDKPLSPISSDPKFESDSFLENTKNVKSDKLPLPVKNLFNGSVNYLNGKPSVLVQIELNLLNKMMVKDKSDPNVLRIKPEMAKKFKDNSLLGKGSIKSSKVTSAKSAGTDIANKSHKVLELNSEVTTNVSSASNRSANNSQTSANNKSSTVSENSEHEKGVSESVSKPKVSQQKVVLSDSHTKAVSDMPDFDSLPIKKPVEKVLSEDSSSESSSSDSDLEVVSTEPSKHVSSHTLSFNQSPPDKKKRKMDSNRADDSKRRKTSSPSSTSSSKVLHNQPTPDRASQTSNHDTICDPSHEDTTPEHSSSNHKKSNSKRERNLSSSSQHSSVSQASTQSNTNHSKPSRRSATHAQRGHKKAKLGDQPPDLNSSQSSEMTQSQIKSSPTALSASSLSSNKHEKKEYTEPVRVNGHIPQQSSTVPRPESDHRSRTAGHRPLPSHHEDEEKPLSGSEYHKKATSYKHKADAMPTVPYCLDKYIVFLESVLYFLLSGVARERDHQAMEASSLFKDTHRLMAHHYHQFRLNQESDVTNKSDVKFTVLCLRIQSLLYLKLYKLKRTENMKLKKVLDDHHNKSVKPTSQPKPPSAPSPHQPTWNRSTGTPSPMSPTPSPASVCSVGSVGSDQTPSKMTNGTSNPAPIAPPGSVLVPQRIHSIQQKYFTTTNYLIQAHELWDQAESSVSGVVKEFISQLDTECGQLTIHSPLLHLVKYCRKGLGYLKEK